MKRLITASVAVLSFASVTPALAANSSFKLEAGWNLANTQVVEQLDVSSLLNDGGALYVLSPQNKKYYGGGGSLSKVEASLELLEDTLPRGEADAAALGWWIYTPKDRTVSVDFTIRPDRVSYFTSAYNLVKGWNLVGINELWVGKSLNDIKGTCTFVAVYAFEHGSWGKTDARDFDDKLDSGASGHAAAFKVVNNCRLNFEAGTNVPNVPALPQ